MSQQTEDRSDEEISKAGINGEMESSEDMAMADDDDVMGTSQSFADQFSLEEGRNRNVRRRLSNGKLSVTHTSKSENWSCTKNKGDLKNWDLPKEVITSRQQALEESQSKLLYDSFSDDTRKRESLQCLIGKWSAYLSATFWKVLIVSGLA